MKSFVNFRVERLFDAYPQPVLLATRVDSNEFSFVNSTTPKLGGVPIRPFVEEVRRRRADGSLDADVFAFVLDDHRDKYRLAIGQVVPLVT